MIRIHDHIREEIAQALRSNESTRKISKRFDVARSTINLIRIEAKIPPRVKGGYQKRPVDADEARAFAHMIADGQTYWNAARSLNRSVYALTSACERHGVALHCNDTTPDWERRARLMLSYNE